MNLAKPVKIIGQRKEYEKDVKELNKFMALIITSEAESKIDVISNKIKNPRDILTNPDKISNQIIEQQRSMGITDDNISSRRVYNIVYSFGEDDYLTKNQALEFASGLMNYYEDYPSVISVSENKDKTMVSLIFSNYSNNGDKLTKQYRPYKATNICRDIREDSRKNNKKTN